MDAHQAARDHSAGSTCCLALHLDSSLQILLGIHPGGAAHDMTQKEVPTLTLLVKLVQKVSLIDICDNPGCKSIASTPLSCNDFEKRIGRAPLISAFSIYYEQPSRNSVSIPAQCHMRAHVLQRPAPALADPNQLPGFLPAWQSLLG